MKVINKDKMLADYKNVCEVIKATENEASATADNLTNLSDSAREKIKSILIEDFTAAPKKEKEFFDKYIEEVEEPTSAETEEKETVDVSLVQSNNL